MEDVYYFAFLKFFLKMPSFLDKLWSWDRSPSSAGSIREIPRHFELRTSRTSLRASLEWNLGDENCGAASCSVEKVSPGDER